MKCTPKVILLLSLDNLKQKDMNSLFSVLIYIVCLIILSLFKMKHNTFYKINIFLCVLIMIYSSYQLIRNYKISVIRHEFNNELRLKYSFSYMHDANSKNWYSFKFPDKEDYK